MRKGAKIDTGSPNLNMRDPAPYLFLIFLSPIFFPTLLCGRNDNHPRKP